ncbi:MAG: hypothetical protein JW862_07140 [Anaerolineales bacterium]|nr:hypothetical protein [Anaerolineales bacterium]
MGYEEDLGYVQAALGQLRDYLLSEQLFGPLSISPPSGGEYPYLTLGGLLLAMKRLEAWSTAQAHAVALQKIENELETLQTRWRVAWGRKASWEFRSRLKQWETYLNEYRQQPEKQAPYYRSEVRWRVILELLRPSASELEPAYLEMLGGLDLILKSYLQGDRFTWQAGLRNAFPPQRFWFLYGQLPD